MQHSGDQAVRVGWKGRGNSPECFVLRDSTQDLPHPEPLKSKSNTVYRVFDILGVKVFMWCILSYFAFVVYLLTYVTSVVLHKLMVRIGYE